MPFDNNWSFGTREEAQTHTVAEVIQREARDTKSALNWLFYAVLFLSLASIAFVFLVIVFDWKASDTGLPIAIGADRNGLTAWARANIEKILGVVGCLLFSGFSLVISWFVLSDIYGRLTGKELSEPLQDAAGTGAVCLKLLCYATYLCLIVGLTVLLAILLMR